MEVVNLVRGKSDDEGTRGVLTVCGQTFNTLELPDRNNHVNLSRINPSPPNGYVCVVTPNDHMTSLFSTMPGFQGMYNVRGTEGRTGVFLHPGNRAGDVNKGFKSDVEGCILLGNTIGTIEGQYAVEDSRNAITQFMNLLDYQPFMLVITNG